MDKQKKKETVQKLVENGMIHPDSWYCEDCDRIVLKLDKFKCLKCGKHNKVSPKVVGKGF
jgi:hypothetical protein